MDLPTSGSVKMRPRARLISLIGEELISDEPVAVVELVKNAYDADADRVSVSFQGKDVSHSDEIVITDNGHGMGLDIVLSAWFEPGTTSKRAVRQSPNGRRYQGEKGIGRFAAARLAKVMLLESKKEGDPKGVSVLIDWGNFDENSYLDDVELHYEVRPIADLPRGTRLTLSGLRKNWEYRDYEELHFRLSRLLSPFGDVKDFVIDLHAPSHPSLSGEVEPPAFILAPRYLLSGRVDANGCFSGKVEHEGKPHREFKEKKLFGKGAIPNCGPFGVEIRAWDRDRDGLAPVSERTQRSVAEIRRTLDAYCGVSIYRDGFRVYPYGQKGNDWLTLDNRSRQNPVKNLANNQVIAAVQISGSSNPGLEDRSNREGMVLNAEHQSLEEWFVAILSLLEEERYSVRPRQGKSEHSEPLFEAFDLASTVSEVKKALGVSHPISMMMVAADRQVRAGVDRVQDVFSRLLMSSGLGHMVDIVIHEIGAPLGKMTRGLVILEQQISRMLDAEELKKIAPQIQSMKSWAEQIHALRQRLDPQTPAKRGRATTFDVKDEIEDNLQLYSALLHKQKVEYELVAPDEPVRVKMSRAALGQIVANLLDNSLYWISADKGVGGGGRMRIEIRPLIGGFGLHLSDDGPGISMEDQSKIFEPYFSRKPNGMGLGLYIARLVIEPYGRLVYRNSGPLPGATFEAIFERSVGL